MSTTGDANPMFAMDSIFIFNSKFAGKREEDDHFKMLTFFPQSRPQNEKMLVLGLCEGVAMFVNNFAVPGDNVKAQCIVTDSFIRCLYEPEEGYWMILCVRCKNTLNNEYQPTLFPLIRKLAISAYETFALFHGPLDEIAKRNGVEVLRHTLDSFLSRYLDSDIWPLKLTGGTSNNPNDLNSPPFIPLSIFYALDGIKFLPVQSLAFLHLHSLMNSAMHTHNYPVMSDDVILQNLEKNEQSLSSPPTTTTTTNNNNSEANTQIAIPITPTNAILPFTSGQKQNVIQSALIFYESYLMFTGNGLTHSNAKTISKYLPLLISERADRIDKLKITDDGEGVFVTGPNSDISKRARRNSMKPSDNLESKQRFSAPRLFLKLNNKIEEFYCVVYKYGKFQICLLVRPHAFTDSEFYYSLKSLLDKEFKRISAIFANSDAASSQSPIVSKVGTFDEMYKYIYFNRSNLAVKSANVLTNPRLVLEWNTVADMHRQFIASEHRNGLSEIFAKVRRDSWVVGKYFGQREFYVVFDQKNFSLVEINDQVHKIQNIFFASNISPPTTNNTSSFD